MQHTSIKMDMPCEFINVTPLNPLISKCQIKVCYVGDTPNRNRSVITKDVATKLANSLPGSPIVGYFNQSTNDFDEHTKTLVISNGKVELKAKTRPYGFVDLNAKCWFQKFLDDGVDEREYLMTEGYLWTGQYPECGRIIETGNNHSMELDQTFLDGYWTKDRNGKPQFFIINEALISKLCVLGLDQEPCFEGASITNFEFSFEDGFKQELSSMIFQLQEILDKGGKEVMSVEEKEEMIPNEYKEDEDKKKKKEEENQDKEEKEEKDKTEDKTEEGSEEKKTTDDEDEKKKKKTEFAKEETCPECGKPVDECSCKNKEYSLEDISEYVELQTQYSNLETQYNDLVSANEALQTQVNELLSFKATVEKKDKEKMIKSFYMLSDEDKKDVVENIDEYSLDDIEAKLSVICVRNKVNFNLEEEEEKENKEEVQDPVSYNLNNGELADDNVPAWVRSLRATAQRQ